MQNKTNARGKCTAFLNVYDNFAEAVIQPGELEQIAKIMLNGCRLFDNSVFVECYLDWSFVYEHTVLLEIVIRRNIQDGDGILRQFCEIYAPLIVTRNEVAEVAKQLHDSEALSIAIDEAALITGETMSENDFRAKAMSEAIRKHISVRKRLNRKLEEVIESKGLSVSLLVEETKV